MKLLVTGGYGFIGSHFINHYFYKNPECTIVNFDAMYYCANLENVNPEIRNSPRYIHVIGNLQSRDLVNHIVLHHEITHVIHFAAQSHVQNSFEESLQYTCDNIVGTHTLLEACRLWGKLERFIHVSTDEVYGESMLEAESKKHEESVLCPTNPYAATKAGAELITMSYYHSWKLPIIITRGNNVYGANQYPEKLIPRFIKLLSNGQSVTIQGDGSNVRSFLHVSDVVNAFDLILEKGVVGEIYNIGGDSNDEYTVLQVAHKLIDLICATSDYLKWIEYIPDRPFNDRRYWISNEKVKALGWEIKMDFDTGLRKLLLFRKK